jgi:hypothetical protein
MKTNKIKVTVKKLPAKKVTVLDRNIPTKVTVKKKTA